MNGVGSGFGPIPEVNSSDEKQDGKRREVGWNCQLTDSLVGDDHLLPV